MLMWSNHTRSKLDCGFVTLPHLQEWRSIFYWWADYCVCSLCSLLLFLQLLLFLLLFPQLLELCLFLLWLLFLALGFLSLCLLIAWRGRRGRGGTGRGRRGTSTSLSSCFSFDICTTDAVSWSFSTVQNHVLQRRCLTRSSAHTMPNVWWKPLLICQCIIAQFKIQYTTLTLMWSFLGGPGTGAPTGGGWRRWWWWWWPSPFFLLAFLSPKSAGSFRDFVARSAAVSAVHFSVKEITLKVIRIRKTWLPS